MKPFLLKLSIILIAVFSISIASDFLVTDSFASRTFKTKLSYLKKSTGNYNKVVFGSSQVYRHFIPYVYDSLTGDNSFNFGVPGMKGHEKLNLFKNAMENGVFDGVSTILFEAGLHFNEDQIKVEKDVDRHRFFYTIENAISDLKMINSMNGNPQEKRKRKLEIIQFLLKSRLKIEWIYRSMLGKKVKIDFTQHGFQQYIMTQQRYMERHKRFLTYGDILLDSLQDFHIGVHQTSLPVPKVIEKEYATLVALANQRGIELQFFISPRSLSSSFLDEAYYLPTLARSSDQSKILDLSNPSEYSEFYKLRNSFDLYHLNSETAKSFTQALASYKQ
jgi:hypothetical protein